MIPAEVDAAAAAWEERLRSAEQHLVTVAYAIMAAEAPSARARHLGRLRAAVSLHRGLLHAARRRPPAPPPAPPPALVDALALAIDDLRHFGQTSHQAHHRGEAGSFEACNRGTCPGVRRALDRSREALRAANSEEEQ